MKARSRSTFRGKRLKLLTSLKRSAELRKEYGPTLDMLLAGRGIRLSDASNLASRMKKEGEAGGGGVEQIIEGGRGGRRRPSFASTGQEEGHQRFLVALRASPPTDLAERLFVPGRVSP